MITQPDGLKTVLARLMDGGLPAPDAYSRGVQDLLHLLGLVDGSGQPGDEAARFLLHSLHSHLTDGVSVQVAWADLIRQIEAARLAAVAHPTPGRQVTVVQAIIKKHINGIDHYLMQYDAPAGRYQPLGGKCDPGDEGSEAALRREMQEELALPHLPQPGALALAPVLSGWTIVELSATYGILTHYRFDFFHITGVDFTIPLDGETRWLSRPEITAGRAADGRPITPILQDALGWGRLDALSVMG